MNTPTPFAVGIFLATLCSFFSPVHGKPVVNTGVGTYGPGIGGDALANSPLGGTVGAKKYFIRFRAEHSSPLVSVTFPFVSSDYEGYGGGTGGDWKLELFADDGSEDHFPTGSPLATQVMTASDTSSTARQIVFSPAHTTTAGMLYHLVFENIDADPVLNFFSVNNWARLSFTEGGQLNPRFTEIDWGNGFFHNGTWKNNTARCSIADLAYGNGQHQGMSYGDASYTCIGALQPCTNEQLVGRIDGWTHKVRERLTVSCRDRTVVGVGVRVLKVPGTLSNLVVSLRNSSNEEIDSVTFFASDVATGPAPTYVYPETWDDLGQKARWVKGNFSVPHTLVEGGTYYLQLYSYEGAYWTWVMRGLTPWYEYSSDTAFSDGWSEYTTDGWTWKSLGLVDFENDLQFYFVTPCAADLNADQVVDGADLGAILGLWGTPSCPCSCPPCRCAGDLNEDGTIDGADISIVLGSWGACES